MKARLTFPAARIRDDFSSLRIASISVSGDLSDGSVWRGTEVGNLIRTRSIGKSHSREGTTDGFLSIAFDRAGNCRLWSHSAVSPPRREDWPRSASSSE